MAVKDISVGDEVVWDYGVRGGGWENSRLVDGVVVPKSVTDPKVRACLQNITSP